ncbi:MAG: kinase [Deltaproteobacteria bacterium]
MIISRTPFRVSFFGGGTDYPAWYQENTGAVLATSIDKYCYVICGYLPPFFDHKYRIVYSRNEMVKSLDEIRHPAVREILRYFKIEKGVSVQHVGDLPARSGIGSSSAFTVGLLHALYALVGKLVSKRQLATEAIKIEQQKMRENVGSQDQVSAAFGGFNKIRFWGKGKFQVEPVPLLPEKLNAFQSHFLLYFTGFSRLATEIAGEQIQRIPQKRKELLRMREMVDEALEILNDDRCSYERFGKLLHEAWLIKRTLSSKITTSTIDEIYRKARRAGATGGKLIGAGGGGFMLFFAPPERQAGVRRAMRSFLRVPFKFDDQGSQIVYYRPDTHF